MSSARKRSSPTMVLVSAAAVHPPPTVTPLIADSSSPRRRAACCAWSSLTSPKYATTVARSPFRDTSWGRPGTGAATLATSGSAFISFTTRATTAWPAGDCTLAPGSTMATTDGTAEAPVAATT